MAKICITGACGHIGSGLLSALSYSQASNHFLLVDNLTTNRNSSLFGLLGTENFQFFEENAEDFDYAKYKPDIVLHLAAATDAVESVSNPSLYKIQNYENVKKLVQKLNKLRKKPLLIFPSTTSVYGVSKPDIIVTEDDNKYLNPQSPYAKYKVLAERYIRRYYKGKHLIFRLGTIIGPSAGMRFHTAVNKFCWNVATRQPITIWKDAYETKRPYLLLSQFIDFIVKIFYGLNTPKKNQTYNVLSGNYKLKEIIEAIEIIAESKSIPISITEVPNPLLNQLSYIVGSDKLGYNLDRKYLASLDDEIHRTLDLLW